MARVGVLSDAAIKLHCPELFPMSMDKYKQFVPTTVETSVFDGVKPDKRFKDYGDFARFPETDFRNFGNISAVNNREVASLNAILNYRRAVGSKNLPNSVAMEARSVSDEMSAPSITNLSDLKPTGKPPAPASITLTASSTSGDSSHVPVQMLDFSITARKRREQMQNFDAEDFRGEKRHYTADARALMGAFPSSTRNDILQRFASDAMGVTPGHRITASDVHYYLHSKATSTDERRDLQALYNQSKRRNAESMMGAFYRETLAEQMEEMEDDE